jgi:Ca2+-binding EF-hand superfamily protein
MHHTPYTILYAEYLRFVRPVPVVVVSGGDGGDGGGSAAGGAVGDEVSKIVKLLQTALRKAAKVNRGHYDFRRPFEKLDKDGSGFISSEEFRTQMRRMCKHTVGAEGVSKTDIEKVLKQFHKDDDVDVIDYRQFCKLLQFGQAGEISSRLAKGTGDKKLDQAIAKLHKALSDKAEKTKGVFKFDKAFRAFDKHGKGRISKKRFLSCLDYAIPEVAKHLDGGQLKKLVEQFDEGGDGEVDYEEFVSFVLKGVRQDDKSTGVYSVDKALRGLQELLKKEAKGRKAGYDFEGLFALFDANGDGWINEREFQDGLDVLDGDRKALTKRQRRRLFSYFDREGYGDIDYRDFCSFAQGVGEYEGKNSTGDKALDKAIFKMQKEVKRRAEESGDGGYDLNEPFDLIDKNGDGVLTHSEIRSALRSMHPLSPLSPLLSLSPLPLSGPLFARWGSSS